MKRNRLSSITVTTQLFQIEPLQGYIGYLADYAGVPGNRIMHLNVLIDEVFSHIVEKCFDGKPDGAVTICVDTTPASLVLTFAYQGLPFAYSLDRSENEADEISLRLIHSLSTSYRMTEDGKRGQLIELSIALESGLSESITAEHATASAPDTEQPVLRPVCADEMEKMVQCLYRVFGYTYSAEAIYYPDMLRERLESGLYRGFVAVNSRSDIVAHVAMLKSEPDAAICECGQAFVSPDYNNRGLFVSLKRMLIADAERTGLRGVYSSAVTGHPYTQMANLKLGGVETGFLLSYIPNNLKSIIAREGEEQRQTVVDFFITTSHQTSQNVYVPDSHREIIMKTYDRLHLDRNILEAPQEAITADTSDIEEVVKSDWNQLHIHINRAGHDLADRIGRILRRAMAGSTAVAYVSLDMTRTDTPEIADILQQQGFIYAGIMPHECHDHDVMMMQFVADTNLSSDYIIAHSPWAQELKQYILDQLHS